MLDKLKRLGSQTFIYGTGNLINKLLGFILIPVYSQFIPIADFGILAVLEISILFLSSLLHFGINSGHQRYFYIEKENKSYGTFLFSNYFGNLLLTMAGLLPLLLFSKDLSRIFFQHADNAFIFQLAMWITLTEIMNIFPLQVMQYEEKPVSYLLLNVIKLVISFSLTIYLIIHYHMGIDGILYARLSGNSIIMVFSLLFIILPRCKLHIDLKAIKKTIQFGFPLIVSSIGYMIFQMSDRYMLNWLSTEAETGKYAFGFKIANIINLLLVQSIGISYLPSVFSSEEKENNVRYYSKVLTYYIFVMATITLVFLLFYKDILSLVVFNNEYWSGLAIVPILSLNFIVLGMNNFVCIGLFLKNKTNYYIMPSLVTAGINILMNFILIPKYGMFGAAASTLTSQIIYTSILAMVSKQVYAVPFEWKKVFLIFFLAIAAFLISGSIATDYFILNLFIRLFIILLIPVSLLKFGFFEPIEKERLKEIFFKWTGKVP
jgi:O-antigen/teichoic acid export membrane protein